MSNHDLRLVLARGRYSAGLTSRDLQGAVMPRLDSAAVLGHLLHLCHPPVLTCRQATAITGAWKLTWSVRLPVSIAYFLLYSLNVLEVFITFPWWGCEVLWLSCLSVCSHISKTTCPKCTRFSGHFTCGRGSIFLVGQCNLLCTSGFLDHVIFHAMEHWLGQNQRRRVCFVMIARWRYRRWSCCLRLQTCFYYSYAFY